MMEELNRRYGAAYEPDGEITIRDDRVFLYSGGPVNVEAKWTGLHIGYLNLALTIEGCQILYPTATKNIVEVGLDEAVGYYEGRDLEGLAGEGFVILACDGHCIGPAEIVDGAGKNTLPASRLIRRRL
jgi:NOL1/NOP2/fmu family ribosome biogenesis protein